MNDNFEFDTDISCTMSKNVLENDVDVPTNAIVEITVQPNSAGQVTVGSDNMITYVRDNGSNCEPAALNDSAEVDSFQYRVCDENGENCSNSATVIVGVYDSYSNADLFFDDRRLFAQLTGSNDFHRRLADFEDQKSRQLSHCLDAESKDFGKLVPRGTCPIPVDRSNATVEASSREMQPWIAPDRAGTKLIAADPGLWSIENFLSPDEADKLLDLMKRNGEDRGLWGSCRHESQITNAHPHENKQCFKISTENACEGPYKVSSCEHVVEEPDSGFVDMLLRRFEVMWSKDVQASSYIKFHHTQGDTLPMALHMDAGTSISMVVYLSDGGAETLFPFVGADGFSNAPKMGSALAWLNVEANGSRNHKASHAVQAHPSSMGDRYVALFQVDLFTSKSTVE